MIVFDYRLILLFIGFIYFFYFYLFMYLFIYLLIDLFIYLFIHLFISNNAKIRTNTP